MSRHGRVLVAMSGGVDSSVTAALLHEQGYEVVGITMKTWDYTSSGVRTGKEVGCCSLESMNDARAVAVRLGFPHFIVDIREEFGDWVIERFTEEYLAGRTPNPCILCNTHIKWARCCDGPIGSAATTLPPGITPAFATTSRWGAT